jgi:hypothetical protein
VTRDCSLQSLLHSLSGTLQKKAAELGSGFVLPRSVNSSGLQNSDILSSFTDLEEYFH